MIVNLDQAKPSGQASLLGGSWDLVTTSHWLTVDTEKLEHGRRMMTLISLGVEDDQVPTLWLLL